MTLLALLQARDEERFLPGWLENVAPSVDGIVALDDGSLDSTADLLRSHPKTIELLRNPPGVGWNERGNHMALIGAGRQHGGTWFLCVDADERLERAFEVRARTLLEAAEQDGTCAYSFQLRELWGSRHHYRADGIWNAKARYRLFRNDPKHKRFDPRPLHRFWMPLEIAGKLDKLGRHSELNLYHLRMIAPSDRAARAERYRTLDPDQLFQKEGYDYLTDETGLQLERIPSNRDFLPANDPGTPF